jgi:hypothetical protein
MILNSEWCNYAYFSRGSFAVKFCPAGAAITAGVSAVFSNPRSLHNRYVGTDPGTFTHFDILVYNSKRINLYIRCQFRIRMYVCMWMNHAVALQKNLRF